MAKILIVDDERQFNETLQARLAGNGYQIITAKDGEEGFEKVETENPDLIILDLMMPKIDGFEVCSTLKNDERHSNIPIIILSAKTQQEDFEKGEEVGADSYIEKPYEPSDLLAKIKEL